MKKLSCILGLASVGNLCHLRHLTKVGEERRNVQKGACVKRASRQELQPLRGGCNPFTETRSTMALLLPPTSSSFYHLSWDEPNKEPECLSPDTGLWGFSGLDDFILGDSWL